MSILFNAFELCITTIENTVIRPIENAITTYKLSSSRQTRQTDLDCLYNPSQAENSENFNNTENSENFNNTQICDSLIKRTQIVERTGHWTGKDVKGFHVGTLVDTDKGQYFIHNTPENNVEIQNASQEMKSNSYQPITEIHDHKPQKNYTIGKAIKKEHIYSQGQYGYISNNCLYTAARIHGSAGTTYGYLSDWWYAKQFN
eukprot:UN11886